jgi:hypothetical protein
MENLTKIDEKELAKYLQQWFNQTNTTVDHFWRRNLVGQVIKNNLTEKGKWKNNGRGKPKLGYLVMKKNQSFKNGDC